MIRAAVLLLAAAACSPAPAPRPRAKPASAAVSARPPAREDLACFPCHSLVRFEKGPPFAHGTAGHRGAGHCHVCHQGTGHGPRRIDAAACLGCHEEGSPAIGILAVAGESGR